MDKETERRNRLPIRPIMGGDGGEGGERGERPYTIRLLKESFREQGFDPRIVDRLASWGRLKLEEGRGFSLFIPSRGGNVEIEFGFHWFKSYWSIGRLHYRTAGADVVLGGFDKLSIEQGRTRSAMRGALKLEGSSEDGLKRVKNVVWLGKSGDFQLTRKAKRG